MRSSHRLLFVAVPALAAGWALTGYTQAPQAGASAEPSYRQQMEQADLAIQKENKDRSELMKNEEYLTTEIGPRLTGSAQMQAATKWTVQRFKDYGLDAHQEDATVQHGWIQGIDSAQLVSPWNKELTVRSQAFSKTTCPAGASPTNADGSQNAACEILASVIVQAPGQPLTADEVKGKIVLQGAPATNNMDPDYQADNAYDSVIVPSHGVPAARGGGRGAGGAGGRGRGANAGGAAAANPLEGAVAVLRDGGKPWGLMSMGNAQGGSYTNGLSPYPSGVMPHEDYDLLYRMVTDYDNDVKMRIALRGSITDPPQTASITVAQIKGTEKPDEQVIIGGHLDSWFLGQGAVDNGTGAMSTLEAARILETLVKTQGWKPKRTLTFILFTGEEEGGIGVNTFITNHKAEMPKVDAVLVDDTGTGKFLSISMDGFWETGKQMNEVYTPLREVFDMQPLDSRTFGSSDHVAFERQGIPAYFGVQNEAHYREEHHTNADTFDKVIPDEVNQGAGVVAAWMWNVSQLDEAFSHHEVAPAGARGGRGGQ